jgi:hypothetical protein
MMKFIEHDVHGPVIGPDCILNDGLSRYGNRVGYAGNSAARAGLAGSMTSLAVSCVTMSRIVMARSTRSFATSDFVHLSHHRLSSFQRGGVRQSHIDQQIAFVLRGNETDGTLVKPT